MHRSDFRAKIMEGHGNDQIMQLPPGFRFHPTDEELITHYLSKKVVDYGFSAVAIAEVDMNKVEPWDLPWRAKLGEKEWYFFCIRDRKYPTGHRTNRATKAGYWKATGKDKEIFRGKVLVGMKKTLVFYQGRAPKGMKSNWVSHEFRLEGKSPAGKSEKNDWVIIRVFQKTSSGEKVHISCLHQVNTDFPGSGLETKPGHVHCFSNAPTGHGEIQGEDVVKAWFGNSDTSYGVDSFSLDSFPRIELFGVDGSGAGLDQGILSGKNMDQEFKQEPGTSVSVVSNGEMGMKMIGGLTEGQDNFDCIWSY